MNNLVKGFPFSEKDEMYECRLPYICYYCQEVEQRYILHGIFTRFRRFSKGGILQKIRLFQREGMADQSRVHYFTKMDISGNRE